MAALDFPASPTLNQTYTANGRTWTWDGTSWNSTPISNVIVSVAGTANEITATTVSGTTTLSLPSALTFTGKTITGGTFNSGAFNGTVGASSPSTGAFTTVTASSTIAATGAVTGSNLSGTNTGDQTTITGNAGTATALQTSRTIGGSSFDGTANVTSFPVPGAIGVTTPAAANFTSIGVTTQGTGAFTTLSASGATTLSSTLRSGNIGFGGSAAQTTVALYAATECTTGVSQYGFLWDAYMTGTAVSVGIGVSLKAKAATTLASGIGVSIGSSELGAGAAITTNYGLKIENQTLGGTNYAIHTGSGLVLFGGNTAVTGTLSSTGLATFSSNYSSTLAGSINMTSNIPLITWQNSGSGSNRNFMVANGYSNPGVLTLAISGSAGGAATTILSEWSSTGLAVTGALSASTISTIQGTTTPSKFARDDLASQFVSIWHNASGGHIEQGGTVAKDLYLSNASGGSNVYIGASSAATTVGISSTGLAVTGTISTSNTGASNTLVVNTAATSYDATISLHRNNVAKAALSASNDGNTYIDYQGTLYWRDSSAYAAKMNLSSAGALSITGALSKGSGSFRIEHPLPEKSATHQLVHSFIEGPQADLIYRGKVVLVDGKASVNIDAASTMTEGTFEVLCRDVQCFTTNETGWTAVRGKVTGNILTIEAKDADCTDEISWMVIGERQDPHMIETDWTDDNGKVIVEPLKPAPASPL